MFKNNRILEIKALQDKKLVKGKYGSKNLNLTHRALT